jgi:hypothetical protein
MGSLYDLTTSETREHSRLIAFEIVIALRAYINYRSGQFARSSAPFLPYSVLLQHFRFLRNRHASRLREPGNI